jgi:intracellular sulfur oxidation DsrE/DsrF family protein
MRKLFILASIAMAGAGAALCQSNVASALNIAPKDSSFAQKFYFPVANYSDSLALRKAMPKLAEQVLANYHEVNKRTYFENCIPYYLLSENYTKAIEMVDSVRKMDDDKSYGVDVQTFALANILNTHGHESFDEIFKTEFLKAFNQLSFPKKVYLAGIDSTGINNVNKDYKSLQEKLMVGNKDTINLDDARTLCEKHFYYRFYKQFVSLTATLIDAKYRQTFPAIKTVKWVGVVPVEHVDEIPDPDMHYNMLFEVTWFDTATKKEIQGGLGWVARELNLHEANGIPRKNISAVVVIHGDALFFLLRNEKYKKKYGIDNPNVSLIKELQTYGVRMIVCGQAMTGYRLEMGDLVPGLKQALTAQTALSSYQLKNYVRF